MFLGRIKFILFSDVTPKTAENFRQFCTGEYRYEGMPVGYRDSPIHLIRSGCFIQGGDFIERDGSGCFSIYGDTFPNENTTIKHDRPGVLSTFNGGPSQPGTNGCQFRVILAAAPEDDGLYVAFGRVADEASMNVLKRVGEIPCDAAGKPTLEVTVSQCGQY